MKRKAREKDWANKRKICTVEWTTSRRPHTLKVMKLYNWICILLLLMENLPFSFSLISFDWHCRCDYHRTHIHHTYTHIRIFANANLLSTSKSSVFYNAWFCGFNDALSTFASILALDFNILLRKSINNQIILSAK